MQIKFYDCGDSILTVFYEKETPVFRVKATKNKIRCLMDEVNSLLNPSTHQSDEFWELCSARPQSDSPAARLPEQGSNTASEDF